MNGRKEFQDSLLVYINLVHSLYLMKKYYSGSGGIKELTDSQIATLVDWNMIFRREAHSPLRPCVRWTGPRTAPPPSTATIHSKLYFPLWYNGLNVAGGRKGLVSGLRIQIRRLFSLKGLEAGQRVPAHFPLPQQKPYAGSVCSCRSTHLS